MNEINKQLLTSFLKDWMESPGKFKHLRMGQAFCNEFKIQHSEIFYQEDDRVIKRMILDMISETFFYGEKS